MVLISVESLFEKANRESGEWLPGVRTCPKQAIPCGNPACADEAMHARQIRSGNPTNVLAGIQATHAELQAHDVADQCGVVTGSCPMEIETGMNRHDALRKLSGK